MQEPTLLAQEKEPAYSIGLLKPQRAPLHLTVEVAHTWVVAASAEAHAVAVASEAAHAVETWVAAASAVVLAEAVASVEDRTVAAVGAHAVADADKHLTLFDFSIHY